MQDVAKQEPPCPLIPLQRHDDGQGGNDIVVDQAGTLDRIVAPKAAQLLGQPVTGIEDCSRLSSH